MSRAPLLVAAALLALAFGALAVGSPVLAFLFTVLAGATVLGNLLTRRASEPRNVTPVAVPPEEVELEEGPVTCCMRCGSIHIRQPRLNEGLIPGAGESLSWICARCKWRGQPLEFDSATSYRQFILGLQQSKTEDSANLNV